MGILYLNNLLRDSREHNNSSCSCTFYFYGNSNAVGIGLSSKLAKKSQTMAAHLSADLLCHPDPLMGLEFSVIIPPLDLTRKQVALDFDIKSNAKLLFYLIENIASATNEFYAETDLTFGSL